MATAGPAAPSRTHRWSLAGHRRVPRTLHPVAWWLWAIGLATAASQTTNPLLLLLVLAVLGIVVANRRSEAPWARAFKYYLYLALVVVVIRVVFRSVFGGDIDAATMHVLFTLPHVPLPSWTAGVQLGGPVTLEGTVAALYDGLRLGTLLCCIGAANALANPKRALRVLPGALYELGVAVVVALSRRPAAGRERPAGPPGPQAPRRHPRPVPRAAQHRHPRARGRLRAFAAAGRGHGLARLRPHRYGHPSVAAAHGRPDAGRHVRPLPRRLRAARRLRRRFARLPGAARRGGAVRRRPGRRQPPGAAHPVPAGPVAAARVDRRRLPGRCRQPSSSPEPATVG